MSRSTRGVGIRIVGRLFNEHPGVAVFVYAIMFIATAWGLVGTYLSMQSYPTQPESLSLQEALQKAEIKSIWVDLTGPHPKCNEALHTESDNVVPLVQEGEAALLVYHPPSEWSCRETQETFQGTLNKIHPKYYAYLAGVEFPIIRSYPQAQVWEFCGGCGPSDTKIGFYLLTPFLLLFGWAIFHYAKKMGSA